MMPTVMMLIMMMIMVMRNDDGIDVCNYGDHAHDNDDNIGDYSDDYSGYVNYGDNDDR